MSIWPVETLASLIQNRAAAACVCYLERESRQNQLRKLIHKEAECIPSCL